MKNFNRFLNVVENSLGSEIISLIVFGSKKGEENPKLSDIDILIILKNKKHLSQIISKIRELESKIIHVSHSELTNLIQIYFLGSSDFTGIHLIAISKEEFDKMFNPKSLRLKFLTKFLISRTIFLYKLKEEYSLIFGKNLLKNIKLSKISFWDRVLSLSLSYIILLLLPFTSSDSKKFKIWCFKASKYYYTCIESYSKMALNNPNISIYDLDFDITMLNVAKKFRYNPAKYKDGVIELYFKTWFYLIRNTSFIWKGAQLKIS